MSRLSALVLCTLLLTAGPAWGLRATPHLDALETTLADRASTLAGATDKTARKQLRAAEKSLARIAVDSTSLAGDLKLAKKIAGPVAKAFAADDEVIDLLTTAADAFETAVETSGDVLARARAGLPDAKLTKKADRLLAKSGKLLTKAGGQSKLKKRLSLLYKAQRSADKARDVLARALGAPEPTRLVLSPPSALLTEMGETTAFEAIVLDQLDRPMAVPVSWSSTDPAVAAVGATGEVTGGGVGSAQILATVGDLETRAVVISARPAPGAIPVPDEAVVGPLLPIDPETFGIGAEYTAVLRGEAPLVGNLLYGTGELPLGGEVVAVEPADSDWLVTLAIVPLDVLFAELEIRETLKLTNEHAEVPEEITELFDAELQEDGSWVFTEREGVDALARRQPRADLLDIQVGPFKCKSPAPFPISLAAGLSLQLMQNFTIDLEYGTVQGLERLVLEGQITATAAFKPRVTAAISASLECKAELLKLNYPLPGPLALVFGAQIPVGIGFKIEGSIQAAQFGFDAVAQFQSTTSAGIQCVAGNCEPVTTSTNQSTATFAWVTPDPSTQFTVTAAARGFGYAELCLGNPLWNLLQLCMLEAQGGVEQTLSWSPTTVQLNNTTSASEYKLLLYFLIGAKAELMNVLGFFNVSLASLQYRADLELARSPEGSFSFAGAVALGETARATLQLTNVDYLGVENVRDVRFYRKGSTVQKAVVPRTSAGQTTYEAEWPATAGDLGAEFGAVVVTEILPLEFEVAPNSLRTLEDDDGDPGDPLTFCRQFLSVLYAGAVSLPDEIFNSAIEPDPCPSDPTVSINRDGATVTSAQQTNVAVGADERIQSVAVSGSAEILGVAGNTAHANAISSLVFTVSDPIAYTFNASAGFGGTGHAYVQLLGSDVIACAESRTRGSMVCPGATGSVASSGTLAPGEYGVNVDVRMSHPGPGGSTYSATLTLGEPGG